MTIDTISEEDLAFLDAFLMSDASPEDCLQISGLDGFLAGIVVGPELILPSEWLPVIWGEENPDFEDQQEAEEVLRIIMGRYNEIIRVLNTSPEYYSPLFWEDEDGNVSASDWAEGFRLAVELRQSAWQPLLEDDDSFDIMMPIAAFWPDGAGVSFVEAADVETDTITAELTNRVPLAAIQVRQYWEDHVTQH